jgi:flagellin
MRRIKATRFKEEKVMGLRINQNIAAQNAYRNLSVTDSQMSKSLEKLSSGFRINRAADDAAGLSISEGLRSQIGGLKVAVRNAQDGISVVQTAEGALSEVHSILQRMRDLSVQASSSGGQDADARKAAQLEVAELNKELTRIGKTTSFGGASLLEGNYGVKPATVTGFVSNAGKVVAGGGEDFTLNIDPDGAGGGAALGAVTVSLTAGTYTATEFASHMESAIKTALSAGSASQKAYADKVKVEANAVGGGHALTLKVDMPNAGNFALVDGTDTPLGDLTMTGAVTAANGTGGVFQVGAKATAAEQITVAIGKVDITSDSLNTTTVDLENNASAAIGVIDAAIKKVSEQRATLGAFQNRFEHTINNLNVAVENLSASESRIRDTDMAQEMVSFTRAQILSQAGTAMLAQANQAPQSVLSLLR